MTELEVKAAIELIELQRMLNEQFLAYQIKKTEINHNIKFLKLHPKLYFEFKENVNNANNDKSNNNTRPSEI